MIESKANSRLKNLRLLLRDKAARKEQGCFIAEGIKLSMEAPAERVREVYVSESFLLAHEAEAFAKGTEPVVVKDELFDSLCDTKAPQGILTVAETVIWDEEAVLGENAPLLLIAESVRDPGNAGTILRSAEAAGAAAVFFSADSAEAENPKTVRASMGSIFRVPCFYKENIAQLLRDLSERGIRSYAAHLEGSVPYDEPDYTGGSAILIGNESRGLTKEAAAAADARIRIPMCGEVNSLNAAMASGICLFEAARQRRKQQAL